MLPDFRRVKRIIAQNIVRDVRSSVVADPLLAEIPYSTVHEGDGFIIERSDGSVEESTYHRGIAKYEFDVGRIRAGDHTVVHDAVAAMSEQLIESTSRTLFEHLQRATEATGNVVNAGGKPFTAEIWLEVMRKMELNFHEDGTWDPPTLVLGPALTARAKEELKRLDTDASLKSALSELLEQKRREWRDRETRRELVD